MTRRARLLLTQGMGGASALLLLTQGFLQPIPTPTPPLFHHAAIMGSSVALPADDEDWRKRRPRPVLADPLAVAAARRRADEELLLMLEVIG